jgi:hypothetical protein
VAASVFRARRSIVTKGWILAAALSAAACQSAPAPAADRLREEWHQVASWQGHGDQQLDWFVIDRFEFRIAWATRDEAPEAPEAPEAAAGAGRFKVLVQSSDSGRVIAEAVDHAGVGEATVYITDDPRRYYLTVGRVHRAAGRRPLRLLACVRAGRGTSAAVARTA